MPILANAKKALRASKRKAVVNNRIRSRVKTSMDNVRKDPSQESLKEAYSAIDIASKKNVIHRNKAARLKSQMAKLDNKKTGKQEDKKKPAAAKAKASKKAVKKETKKPAAAKASANKPKAKSK
jgi:small subunit ribosomal protein S20